MRLQVVEQPALAGSASSVMAAGVTFLQPEEAVFEGMVAGWMAQQQSRLLAGTTVENRASIVRRLVGFTNEYPWAWRPVDVEEWTSSLVGADLAHSTIRNYQMSVSLFLGYISDPRYGWIDVCESRFGTPPVQVFHEWNTAVHRAEDESRPDRRPLSRDELQTFFDYCDDVVVRAESSGRKGWLAAYRDAVLFKTIYAWGLRRREAAMLDISDWGPNAKAPAFGRYGVLNVRWGKASRGSPPRQRSVLTVMSWASEGVAEWIEEVRPAYVTGPKAMMWPTERASRVASSAISARFAAYRDAIGLDTALTPHCLRHSYITHLIEDGFDQLFVQQQVGHRWGSSTAGYTKVGSDYLQSALARALGPALLGPSYPAAGES
ncbi:MAG TPA: site-specific integrase [Acidimicrobiales bacterium]|nr:site-specific integrase [Acidimicrobiales bacterium]